MPVPESDRSQCLLRQFKSLERAVQNGTPPIEAVSEHPALVTAYLRPNEFTCPLGQCAVRGEDLLNLVYGENISATEVHAILTSISAPACQIHDTLIDDAPTFLEDFWPDANSPGQEPPAE